MLRRALIAFAIPTLLSAQSSDPTIDRIFRLGMDSSRLAELGQVLLDSIGPRLTGSPGMTSASDWVIKMYRSWGIEARRENYGTWRGWRRGASHIDLVQPRVRSLEGMMLAWSPGTKGANVTAEAVVLPKFNDSTEFVRWLPQARGKLVLLSPMWPTCRASDDFYRWATPASRARMDSMIALNNREWAVSQDSTRRFRGTGYSARALSVRLEKAGVAGVATSQPTLNYTNPFQRGGGAGGFGGGGAGGGPGSMRGGPNRGPGGGFGGGAGQAQGSGGWGVVRVFDTDNTIAPAISLSCEDYGLLYRLAENEQKPMVRLNLTAELLGEVPAFNTIGVIKGVEKPDEYVMLSAHFDSWDGGSGATDNGTGTLMAMEAMRLLELAYPRPKRTIMVGHWNSEEQGLNGSRAFAEDHPEVLRGLQALFNQDNGTGRVQSISATGLTPIGPHLRDWYAKLPSFYTDSASPNSVSWTFNDRAPGNPGGTDGAVFTCYATPSFGLGALSWNYNAYTWHTQRDTYDKVVFDDLKHNATLAALLVYLASEDPKFIERVKSPGNWPESCGLAPRKTRGR